jgi:TonB family protein
MLRPSQSRLNLIHAHWWLDRGKNLRTLWKTRALSRKMSESVAESSTAPTSTAPTSLADPRQNYALHSDLARMCLPSEFKDSYRTLAWIDSICFLFLVIGLIGLREPQANIKPLTELAETAPVIFTPPEEQPQPEPEIQPNEPEPQATPTETPQVVTIVAAVDSPSIAFAVPVQGAVAVASPRFATPPPPANVAPKPTKFNPDASAGSFPKPTYPGFALRNRQQGTVTVRVTVDPSGAVVEATIASSSGFTLLDDAAVKTVKERWKWLPGGTRIYDVPVQFKLE